MSPPSQPPHGARGGNAAAGSAFGSLALVSADLEPMVGLIATARCRPAAGLGRLQLVVADLRQNGAQMLVLDDCRLRHLLQLVEDPVRKLDALVGDRQAALGIG